ncbi:MAG: SET domain-containing protein-lysine N-methyltransferase [Pseudomonadota bacterium]
MTTVRRYLAPSSIEGLEAFAAAPIKSGDIVWRFDPRLDQSVPRVMLQDQLPHVRERCGYDHPDAPDMLVLDADEGRFMNHADEPDLDFTPPDVGWARRDIAAGEELT